MFGRYFEVSRPTDSGTCSDNDCPCGYPGTTIPRGTGYLYISPEVVEFRRNAKSEAKATKKLMRLPDIMVLLDPNAVASPILMCETAADRRGLDKDQAAADAQHWWRTGKVPLRPTRHA